MSFFLIQGVKIPRCIIHLSMPIEEILSFECPSVCHFNSLQSLHFLKGGAVIASSAVSQICRIKC